MTSDITLLWGKTKRGTVRYHPLLFHMLDVAAVADLLWEQCLTLGLRKRLEGAMGRAHVPAQIRFLAGAHDLGKASPGFQKKAPELAKNLGLRLSDNDRAVPHGFISAHILSEVLGSNAASAVLSQITGGHHGIFPRSADMRMGRDTLGDQDWESARKELLAQFAGTVGFDLGQLARPKDEITDPAVVPILAGFISVVDWIASNPGLFECSAECGVTGEFSVAGYWSHAHEKAQNALDQLGWLPAVTFATEARFDVVYPNLKANAVQEAVTEIASRQTAPYMMIVEAPMGGGKTEAALFAADLAMCRGFARGMYVAMPTQATGNAMFKRVLDDYLKGRGHQGRLNLQLVHGDALLAQMAGVKEGEIGEFKAECVGDEPDSGGNDAVAEAQSWFTSRKRPLLAPFGVGTIDQSLLSVLQTKHWFVRLFGLAGKVVIFDEVHAYDAYMNTILERLLCWLAELDCTVILLSATLPEAKRRALARAYSGRNDGMYKRYPRITLARPHHYPDRQTDSQTAYAEIPMGEPRTVALRFEKTDLSTLTTTLQLELEHGGCAAVICNTVDRSIEVFKHLRDSLEDTECSLFHARTLKMWRREREEEVLHKFGKGEKRPDGTYFNPHRPSRAVLVATQVVEQSLDLDFDLMVSEIAPVDLLLQRCGRVHRHPRKRPEGLESPRFIVLCDAEPGGSPPASFGKSIEYVYDRYILLRTWFALQQRGRPDEIVLPLELEPLVEAVYGESVPPCSADWNAAFEKAGMKMEADREESEKAAGHLLIDDPKNPNDLVEEFNDQLIDEEDPGVHKTVIAATREGDPSITVVMLSAIVALTHEPNVREIRALLDQSARLSHKGVFNDLLNGSKAPPEWERNSHLRHSRLLRLDERNQAPVGRYVLTVDRALGVVIERNGSKDV